MPIVRVKAFWAANATTPSVNQRIPCPKRRTAGHCAAHLFEDLARNDRLKHRAFLPMQKNACEADVAAPGNPFIEKERMCPAEYSRSCSRGFFSRHDWQHPQSAATRQSSAGAIRLRPGSGSNERSNIEIQIEGVAILAARILNTFPDY
jgi:hypothetical protein